MCQIMPPRPGRSSHTVAGSSSYSTSISPTIRPVHLGNELDARPVVMLLLALHGVVVRAVQEGEHPAFEPASLVRILVRPDHDFPVTARRVGRPPVFREARRPAGVHEMLEMRERLRHGEAAKRGRERVREERA